MPKKLKATTNTNTLNTIENTLKAAQQDASKECKKLSSTLTTTVSKLKMQLKKEQAKKKKTKDQRVKVVAQAKKKPGNKSIEAKLEKVRKEYETAASLVDSLKADYDVAKQELKELKLSEKKFSMLSKIVEKFQKEWDKKRSKVAKLKSKPKTKSKPKVKVKAKSKQKRSKTSKKALAKEVVAG